MLNHSDTLRCKASESGFFENGKLKRTDLVSEHKRC